MSVCFSSTGASKRSRGPAPRAVEADDAVASFEAAREHRAQEARGACDHDGLHGSNPDLEKARILRII